MQNLIHSINQHFQSPTDIFHPGGYIRLNMLYISPVCIKLLKNKLHTLGMKHWAVTEIGLTIKMLINNVELTILFSGQWNINFVEDKIFALELDFNLQLQDTRFYYLLYEIESYLKGMDAIFFMCYEVDLQQEILENPLAYSVEYMWKRIEERKM